MSRTASFASPPGPGIDGAAPSANIRAHPAAGGSIQPGGRDPAGRPVRRVYADTELYAIYSTDDPETEDDLCGLRHHLKRPFEEARALRAQLAPIAVSLARLSDMLCGMRPLAFESKRDHVFGRERAFELMARSMGFAFDGQEAQARAVLAELEAEVVARRDSKNRMRYVVAATLAFAVVLGVGLALEHRLAPRLGGAVPVGDATVSVVDALLLGACGAFFSVVYDVGRVKVSHCISVLEMLYAGFVRIPVGMIAAGAVVLLLMGGWVLSGLEDGARAWSLLLLAFLAGFSEMFVPNVLKEAEGQTPARAPAAA